VAGACRSGSRGAGAVTDVRVRVAIAPWTDGSFVHAVEDVLSRVTEMDEVELSSGDAVEMAERLLRAEGYPSARILDRRSVEEALHHVTHWSVLRDGTW
jgi:hypothetical protein